MKSAVVVVLLAVLSCALAQTNTFAIWHCGNDCTWTSVPDLNSTSAWIIDRGDGNPTFNLVILAFADPMNLLNQSTNDQYNNGIPRGITSDVISFFTSHGVAVQISIGGGDAGASWDMALAQDPVTLAKNVAAMSQQFNVGIEIDYEEDNADSDAGLNIFVQTYRTIIPLDATNPATALTVDTGGGIGYLESISQLASGWFSSNSINWLNAMVDTYSSIDEATGYWEQHLQGDSSNNINPVAPGQLSVALFEQEACTNYQGSITQAAIPWIKQNNVKGLFLWAEGSDMVKRNLQDDCPGLRQASYDILGGGSSSSTTDSNTAGTSGTSGTSSGTAGAAAAAVAVAAATGTGNSNSNSNSNGSSNGNGSSNSNGNSSGGNGNSNGNSNTGGNGSSGGQSNTGGNGSSGNSNSGGNGSSNGGSGGSGGSSDGGSSGGFSVPY